MKTIEFTILVICVFLTMSSHAQTWNLAPFTLSDHSTTFDNAWAGGFTAPQFYSLDFDFDGTDDLLVFDRQGGVVMMFEAIPDGDCVRWHYRYDWSSTFPYLIEFVIVADANSDGIPDLYTYSQTGISGLQIYLGKNVDGEIRFDLLKLNPGPFNVLSFEFGSNVFNLDISRIDMPAIYDINGDGDLDILTFSPGSPTMYYYENMMVERGLSVEDMIFVNVETCFGGFYEGEFTTAIDLSDEIGGCASAIIEDGPKRRHNGSTTLVWDPNYDGLPDLLIGDLTSPFIVSLINGGTLGQAWMTAQDIMFPEYDVPVGLESFNSAFYVDVNCDEKKDLIFSPNSTTAGAWINNVWLYENMGFSQDTFEFKTNSFLSNTMLDLGSRPSPAIADINGDGFLDILIGTAHDFNDPIDAGARLVAFMHNGDPDHPGFVRNDSEFLQFSQYARNAEAFSPTFGDMDSDGDLDLIVADDYGELFYLENIAGPNQPMQFAQPIFPWMDIDDGNHAAPVVADLDGDGLLDLIIGEKNVNNDVETGLICGNINFYKNIGTPQSPMFIPDSRTPPNTNCLGDINTKYPGRLDGSAAPAVYFTGTKYLFFVGSNIGSLAWYEVGDIEDSWILMDSLTGNVRVGINSRPAVADLDNDGFLDFVVGNERGGLSIYASNIYTDGSISSTVGPPTLHEKPIVYPNPINSGGLLKLSTPMMNDADILLYDLQGANIWHSSISSGGAAIQLPLVAPGAYLISIETQHTFFIHKLIIL